MESSESTEGSQSRSSHVQPSSEGLGSSSEQFPSLDGGPRAAVEAANAAAAAAAAATVAASTAKAAVLSAKTQVPYFEGDLLMNIAFDGVLGQPSSGSNFTHAVSCVADDPCTTNDLSSSPGPVAGSSPGPSSGPVPGSSTDHDSGQGTSPDVKPGPACDSGPSPGGGNDSELSPYTLTSFKNPGADPVPNYASRTHYQHWEPQKQSWKFLPVSEPVAQRLWKAPEVEGNCKIFNKTLPRGQCLLYNWQEERATNHLDQVPSMQDGSESFCFRHGHQGLLALQLQPPMPLSTTQKDSYQLPGSHCQPIQGKREAMLERLLRHQICKEVQAEQEPTREPFEVESVTHHDYKKELVQAGPPAPTKPHDYRKEQPETFWIQKAPQLPGVSNIKTLDTPFRKNCSFSTPVPLSMGQPLPYEPENYSNQLEESSSLGCQGRGQSGGGGRTV